MANTVKILPDGRVQKLFDIPGAAGVGIPFGGDAGQVLTKVSGEDFDAGWVNTLNINDVNNAINTAIGEFLLGVS